MDNNRAMQRILVADDEPINVKALVDLLRPFYSVVVAKDGAQALERMQSEQPPDLALFDVMMPNMSGLEACKRMKADPHTADVPVIFVTALDQPHDETVGFEMGAVDYIYKPISPPVVLARVRTHLALRRARSELERRNFSLEKAVAERTQELAAAQDVTIRALASLAEARDNETGAHIRRTQHFVRRLAEELRHEARFEPQLSDRAIDMIFKSAPLHDIGKVGIPDHILLKPGKLTPEEFEIMKTHVELGRQALLTASEASALPSEFLRYAIDICGGHHEKWDGSGYPTGLAGEDIPLAARLMAVADVYDALTTRRVYKPAFAHSVAVGMIEAGSGKHFDPAVVDAFRNCTADFRRIAETYFDDEAERAA
jgi:putative two-component system response regulator